MPPERGACATRPPTTAAACAAIYAPYVDRHRDHLRDRGARRGRDGAPHRRLRGTSRLARAGGRRAGRRLRLRRPAQGSAPPTAGRARSASTCEQGLRRTGAGRALYEALLARLDRARLPRGDRRHDAAQRGERRPAPGARIRARRHLPPRRLEARRLARRRLGPAPARRRSRPAGRADADAGPRARTIETLRNVRDAAARTSARVRRLGRRCASSSPAARSPTPAA